MSVVVADTTPLNYFAKLADFHLLREIFGHIAIPPAVLREVNAEGSVHPVRLAVDSAIGDWMEVVAPIDLAAVSALSTTRRLDDGESEAIVLALELRADVVLMDERRGVACARERGLRVIRTPLIYAEAGARGLISDLRPKLDMLRAAGFYLSERHYRLVLDAIDAGRPPS